MDGRAKDNLFVISSLIVLFSLISPSKVVAWLISFITHLSMVDGNTAPGKITIDNLQRVERR